MLVECEDVEDVDVEEVEKVDEEVSFRGKGKGVKRLGFGEVVGVDEVEVDVDVDLDFENRDVVEWRFLGCCGREEECEAPIFYFLGGDVGVLVCGFVGRGNGYNEVNKVWYEMSIRNKIKVG